MSFNVKNNNLNKEAIASRMVRNAAKVWGYNDTDIDNFDPLVRLIIEACAVEVFTINNELYNLQNRMLERLAKLLTPTVNTTATPSHAILHSRSLEAISNVFPSLQFFHHKKVASKSNGPLDSNIDIFFGPASNYKIFDGDVKYIACGNNVYEISQETQSKESFLRSEKKIQPYTAWVGLELNPVIESLEGLSFFIDIKNLPDKELLLDLLPFSRWGFENSELSIEQGIWDAANNKIAADSLFGVEEFMPTPNIEQNVYQFYKNHFITINHSTLNAAEINAKKSKYPVDFEKIYYPEELKNFKEDLCWFKISFPPSFNETVLDELTISINCYPVINRHLNEVRYSLQSHFNIIPLITSEQYLDVRNVQNISGRLYVSNPLEKDTLTSKGTYSVRSSGVEHFDSRNAKEHLNYITELLRDESNAFAAYGQDFISSLIKELNQNISQIEQKIQQNSVNINSRSTFLFLKPYEENENVFVEFWTTNGEMANMIRSGLKLNLYSGNDINRETLVLMTPTISGRDKPKNTDLLTAYKTALLSRDRVVTQQDIKNICTQIFGAKLQKVDVKKGVAISNIPNEGLISTIDVYIKPLPALELEELDALKQEVLIKLKQSSVLINNYRVFLN